MLTLGKSLNRNYNLRLSFLDGYYNIGLFFNNKSTFLLFSVDSDFSQSESTELKENIKINMFKNEKCYTKENPLIISEDIIFEIMRDYNITLTFEDIDAIMEQCLDVAKVRIP